MMTLQKGGKTIKPQSAKSKGRNFQKYVRDKLLETFPDLEPDDVRSTSMGAGGEDLQMSPAARKKVPYQIECKSKATSQVHTYYDQAKSHGPHEPVVIVKKDRSIPLVIMSLDHFLKLLKEREAK
jgi:hypothetical protein